MDIEIITRERQFVLFGFGGTAPNKDYAGACLALSRKMWEVVNDNRIRNKGKNIWVYDEGDRVFAGVELESPLPDHNKYKLEKRTIILEKYAFHKHVGPYHLIKQTGQNMTNELTKRGLTVALPYLELYGHWTSDETRLETALIRCLK